MNIIYTGRLGSQNSLSVEKEASSEIKSTQPRFLLWTILFLIIQEEQGNKATLPEVSSCEFSPIPLIHKQQYLNLASFQHWHLYF